MTSVSPATYLGDWFMKTKSTCTHLADSIGVGSSQSDFTACDLLHQLVELMDTMSEH